MESKALIRLGSCGERLMDQMTLPYAGQTLRLLQNLCSESKATNMMSGL